MTEKTMKNPYHNYEPGMDATTNFGPVACAVCGENQSSQYHVDPIPAVKKMRRVSELTGDTWGNTSLTWSVDSELVLGEWRNNLRLDIGPKLINRFNPSFEAYLGPVTSSDLVGLAKQLLSLADEVEKYEH